LTATDPFTSAIATALRSEVEPLRAEVARLTSEVAALREASSPVTFITMDEAAERLGISLSTVRRRIRAGEIPARKIGRNVRVDVKALRPLSEDEVARLAREARNGDGLM
jgi:excisionase family DNA binding protein